MKLESVGILIGMRPMNERDSIARVFTRDFGVLVGVMRGAIVAKKNRPLLGQVGAVSWNARLDSQLGVFHWDAEKNLSASLIMDAGRLACMNAAFELLVALLPERESYAGLYNHTYDMLRGLATGDTEDVYLQWEINLLRELGYALDLTKCSGCGGTENLCWVSPRTGRAVCATCGAPYADRLYPLPVGLGTTMCFLDSVCQQQGTEIPLMRRMLNLVQER